MDDNQKIDIHYFEDVKNICVKGFIDEFLDLNNSHEICHYNQPQFAKYAVKLTESNWFPLDPGYRAYFDKLVCEYINKMDYTDFLQTNYWRIVAGIAKKVLRMCQVCNSTKDLRVHHRTYERHGYEHHKAVMMRDLTVLCDECHKKFHNITEGKNEQ